MFSDDRSRLFPLCLERVPRFMYGECLPCRRAGGRGSRTQLRGSAIRADCYDLHSFWPTCWLVPRKCSERRSCIQRECPGQPCWNRRVHTALLSRRPSVDLVCSGWFFVCRDLLAECTGESRFIGTILRLYLPAGDSRWLGHKNLLVPLSEAFPQDGLFGQQDYSVYAEYERLVVSADHRSFAGVCAVSPAVVWRASTERELLQHALPVLPYTSFGSGSWLGNGERCGRRPAKRFRTS